LGLRRRQVDRVAQLDCLATLADTLDQMCVVASESGYVDRVDPGRFLHGDLPTPLSRREIGGDGLRVHFDSLSPCLSRNPFP